MRARRPRSQGNGYNLNMRSGAIILTVVALLIFSATCLRANQSTQANGATTIQASQTATVKIPRVPALAPAGADSRYLTTSDGWHVAAW